MTVANGMAADAKQEILGWLKPYTDGNRGAVENIRKILETHTLEPIDERPFDPTLCGFVVENEYRTDDVCQSSWGLNFEWRIIKTWSNTHDPVLVVQYECGGQDGPIWEKLFDGPCPETQRDFETLLRLLGVEL